MSESPPRASLSCQYVVALESFPIAYLGGGNETQGQPPLAPGPTTGENYGMAEGTAPKPGDVLAGKYRVDRVLGEGGMGVVVEATHTDLDQRVALKFMHANLVEVGLDRFMREAKAVAKLKGEHVARVMDVGRLEDGSPYIVMEFLEGEDLGDLLERRGTLPLQEAVDYVLQVAMALAEAHSRGIVHRDIKPRNVFLTRKADGTPLIKVLDFGISKLTNTPTVDDASTHTGAVLGSPKYMSPEQTRSSKNVDVRTDIWSLGVVLYELYTGRLPFLAETLPDMFVAILHSEFEPPSRVVPGTPPGLDEVLQRCLAKKPAERYPSMAELARALEPFASAAGVQSAETVQRLSGGTQPLTRITPAPAKAPDVNAETSATQPLSISKGDGDAQRVSGRRVGWYAAAALIALGAIVLAMAVGGGKHDAPAAAAASADLQRPTASPVSPSPAATAPAEGTAAGPRGEASFAPPPSVAPPASKVPSAAPERTARPALLKPNPPTEGKPTQPVPQPKPPAEDPFGTIQ